MPYQVQFLHKEILESPEYVIKQLPAKMKSSGGYHPAHSGPGAWGSGVGIDSTGIDDDYEMTADED